VLGITFKLLHLSGGLINVSEEPTSRFTIKAGGRDERVTALLSLWPRLRIELNPIIPTLFRRKGSETNPARAGIECLTATFCLFAKSAHAFVLISCLVIAHLKQVSITGCVVIR
jgi:hypothetical protein